MKSIYDLKGNEVLSLRDKAGIILSTNFANKDFHNLLKIAGELKIEGELNFNFGSFKKDLLINNRTFGDSKKYYTDKSGYKRTYLSEDRKFQVADDWDTIHITLCRSCKKENVKKYNTMYFEHFNEYSKLYCFENGYCEECAKRHSETKHVKRQLPYITRMTSCHYAGDKYATETWYLSDGSIIESNDGWKTSK